MKNNKLVVVYGSYGYTGTLIVNLCKEKGLQVVLAGRNREALQKQSETSGYPFEVVDSADVPGLKRLLEPAALVIHCGGPFKHTAKAMAEACLATQTHYTDITGEYQVFEMLADLDAQGKQAGILLMPGTGFDVVPSDCLAAHLKSRLPSATHLQLAFASTSPGTSRGTKKTSVESLGNGGLIRKDGKLTRVPLGQKVLNVDFGSFHINSLCIPWGDISTAWRSTGIPNIEVFMGATDSMIRNARLSNYLGWLLRLPVVQNYLMKQIDRRSPGPSDEKRERGKSFLWGKVWDETGKTCMSRLVTLSGYTLTAKTAVLIAEKILAGNFKPGYQTPSLCYGPDLIMEIEGTTRIDL
ncbi:MAG: saccharopine dehydrogenase NADP-binding domain-containing protein [Cyclobacteriaceae bacterium]|nr:saccharopine dehydrogenase NADP-binding domain-containing protein [Cyclobacteriaceae bacterium]